MAKNPDFEQDIRLFSVGARPDVEVDLLSQQPGFYIDALNMRPDSVKGRKGSIEKAGYITVESGPSVPNQGFTCLGAVRVNQKKVSCWAENFAAVAPFIIVDGVKVAENVDLPFVYKKNFQIDANENCIGGEIFIAADGEPIILNVQDMVDAVTGDPLKYFADFNLAAYSVNLSKPLDIPVFINLETIGGGGGLAPGMYRYSIRYVTDIDEETGVGGDATEWSPYTPFIPAIPLLGSQGSIYPFNNTIGREPTPLAPTNLGIRIRFRITNTLDFGVLQIKRQASNTGAALDVFAEEFLIAQIPLTAGEISVKDFIDPADITDAEVVAPTDAVNQRLSHIDRAKSIRYFDKRLVLMNIETPQRDEEPTFTDSGGEKIYSCIENLGKIGLKDPYNAAYYKPYMNGEKLSFGPVMFDGVGGIGFVTEDADLKNFQIPNRRDPLSQNSQDVSYNGFCRATNVSNVVGPVHEVFDLTDAKKKTDKCTFKNIFDFDSFSFPPDITENYGRLKFEVNIHAGVGGSPTCGTTTGAIEAQGATVNTFPIPTVHPDYHSYHPTKSDDTDQSGHNYIINPKVIPGNSFSTYTPEAFEPNYYATGIAIDGLDNIPSWAKSFSVVRSKEAGRVVVQGMGFYAMREGTIGTTSSLVGEKEVNRVWFFSQDIKDGFISPETLQDIKDNPSNYGIQFVAPMGYFSEVYNFELQSSDLSRARDFLIDMITYPRIITDDGQINPGERTDMGIVDPLNGKNYVGFGKYRGNANPNFTSPNDGNRVFSLTGFGVASSEETGRGGTDGFFEMVVSPNVYNNKTSGAPNILEADFETIFQWHEPMYIVNIVQIGKTVPDRTTNEYLSTGHYQKIESIIGEGDGTSGQTFILVDERWEDCIPALTPTSPNANDNRYIYIRNEGQIEEEIWVNVTFKTGAQKITIQNDINANGFFDPGDGTEIVGMFSHINTNNRFFTLVFDQLDNDVPNNAQVLVRYDNDVPIRVFGGNVSIADNIFAPIDRTARGDENVSEGFEWGTGLPNNDYSVNGRYYIIKRTETSIPNIPRTFIQAAFDTFEETATICYLRQLVCLFIGQSKSPMHYAFGDNHFPQVHYIIRPNRGTFNNINGQYESDYGSNEDDSWSFGGFRFLPSTNIDYAKEPPIEYFSKPKVGFVEVNEFCTRIVSSLPRQTNQQNSPSLRTFLATNIVDIADDMGEIKRSWDAMSGGKGENLYALTERGICMLLTKKAILSDLNSDEIGLFTQESFIFGEYWLDKNIGLDDEYWRASVEASAAFQQETGNKIRRESLFFMNKTSIFRMTDNNITDILEGQYYSEARKLFDQILAGFGTDLTMGYDYVHDELYVGINQKDVIVYNQDEGSWIGKLGFRPDQYISFSDKIYGLFGQQEILLNSGTVGWDQGTPPDSFVTQASSMRFFEVKSHVNLGVNSNYIPTKIEILEEDLDDPTILNVIATINPVSIRDYKDFEAQIPRRDDNGDRVEGNTLIYRIYHDTTVTEEFRIVHSRASNKVLY